jgi:hypothetical protein
MTGGFMYLVGNCSAPPIRRLQMKRFFVQDGEKQRGVDNQRRTTVHYPRKCTEKKQQHEFFGVYYIKQQFFSRKAVVHVDNHRRINGIFPQQL